MPHDDPLRRSARAPARGRVCVGAARRGPATTSGSISPHVGDRRVSTVWLGADHSFGLGGPPLYFETAIFGPDEELEIIRTPTEAAAIAAHDQAVAHVRATVKA